MSRTEIVDRTVTATTANNVNVSLTNDSVLAPFLSKLVSYGTASLMMLPASILNSIDPNIGVTVNSCVMPMMLNSGAEVTVAPIDIVNNFDPPITISSSGRKDRTFGNSTVHLLGPVSLNLQLCGLKSSHPFYFIDVPTPLIGGYDLMKATHLVVDIDNQLVWSRRTQPPQPGTLTPNPPVSLQNRSVYSRVMFVQPTSF